MNGSNDIQEATQPEPSFRKRFLRIFVPLVIALLAGGILLTAFLGEHKLQRAFERYTRENRELAAITDSSYADIQRRDIRLFALPLAWSVRKELIRADYEQIDEYFNELIKRKEFGVIMLVEPSGIIRVSTDRKLQGTSFSRLYPGMTLVSTETVSYPLKEGKSIFLVPVMGLNAKTGTIAFVYSYQKFLHP